MDTRFTNLPIKHTLSLEMRMLLNMGGFSVGGYPLYLCGGVSDYSDIDVFAPDSPTWGKLDTFFKDCATPLQRTAHAQPYRIKRTWQQFDLVDEGFKDFNWQEVTALADLSPAACALVLSEGVPVVKVLYIEDVKHKMCRVLTHHEFTDYRVKIYKEKGYKILA